MTDDETAETIPIIVWEYFPEHESHPLAGGLWRIAKCPLSPMGMAELNAYANDCFWGRVLEWLDGPADGLPVIVAMGYKYNGTGIILTNVAYPSTDFWHGNEPRLPQLDGLLATVGADHFAGLERVGVTCLRKTVGINLPRPTTRPRSRHA